VAISHQKIWPNMAISKEAGYKYSQILQNSWSTPNFLTKNVVILLGIFQKIALTMLMGTFFFAKWQIFTTKKRLSFPFASFILSKINLVILEHVLHSKPSML